MPPQLPTADLIPRSVLFGNPERVNPAVSPDGTRLGWLAPREGVLNVWVGSVGGDDARPLTDDKDRGIQGWFFAPDNRHVLYVQDRAGDENWRLYDVDLDTGATRDLTPFDDVQAQVVRVDKHFPDRILVGLNADNPQLHDVYLLDLPTGQLTRIVENPGFVGWLADPWLRVRAGVAPTPDGGMAVMVRDGDGDDWRVAVVFSAEDALTSGPVGFTADGTGLFLQSSAGANAGRLVRLDLATGAEQVIVEDPVYDVSAAIQHPDTYEMQLVVFEKERADYVVLDPGIEADVDGIRRLHPGDFFLTSRDDADRIWLVGFTADDGPVPYFAWDRATRQGTFLFDHRPELRRHTLAPMEPYSYATRDGLTVHGYVTFPVGVERRDLPAVLFVHGGPWHRDTWGFNAEAQWLANRGYLCVQVNFRGSTGYGKDFVNAGDKEWGGRMHDDLVDAVQHVVAQGWADPARIGIFGGSYGGFAALTAATLTPELFRCAVDIVGPSNLKTFIEGIPPYWAPLIAQLHNRVGNPETEADFLWERSPLSRADRVSIPLLIAQGANDPRVKREESEQIVAALEAKGIPHTYLLFEDEGHGFVKPENRMHFYAVAERFLADHLQGRYEA